mmetsp:Transcript_4638/g.6610  ORF Transcript_4638/g.6610 Transcript_4638/m.6610 type:complete len:440 (+) Transcript_4638:70-1389(+)
MLVNLAEAKQKLRKRDVRVTGLNGACHIEDATGAKLQEVAVLDVNKASEVLDAEAPPVEVEIVRDGARLTAPSSHAHGSKGDMSWAMPRLTKWCEASARPGYLTLKAHEYLDEDSVLHAKVRLLASMLREAKSAVAYTGAGISVSAGIPDWATKHVDSSAAALTPQELAKVAASARPTLAHRVLTSAHFAGLLPKWVQQNHDGLPQKAGFPQQAMNEIHGAIFDPSNPLVPMDGKVRDDLHTDLLHCQRGHDLVLALGSSLAGMAADELVTVVADRARRGKALGVVIINLQQTVRDEDAALRIFAPLDRVAALLAEELQLSVLEMGNLYTPRVPQEHRLGEDIFSTVYGHHGCLLPAGEDRKTLDLSQGASVKITAGPRRNTLATVDGKDEEGHYLLRVGSPEAEESLLLGSWWIEAAVLGTTSYFPVTSTLQPCNTMG